MKNSMPVLTVKSLLVFVASLIVSLAAAASYTYLSTSLNIAFLSPTPAQGPTPPKIAYSPDIPPPDTLKGNILSTSGNIDWQSRVATESARISSITEIEQGEVLGTEENSLATVQFPNVLAVNLNQKTEVNFAQTLPIDLTLAQTQGTAEYIKLGNTPVSIRILHLLIEDSGDINVTVDDKRPVVTVQVAKGSITAAFNDIKNTSTIIEVKQGKRLIFNDQTRRVIIRNR